MSTKATNLIALVPLHAVPVEAMRAAIARAQELTGFGPEHFDLEAGCASWRVLASPEAERAFNALGDAVEL